MKLRRRQTTRREPDLVALINIVFLMLIFFLVAATLRPFSLHGIEAPQAGTREGAPKRLDRVYIERDGGILLAGARVPLEDLAVRLQAASGDQFADEIAIIADRALAGRRLMEVVDVLKSTGVAQVRLVTVRRK